MRSRSVRIGILAALGLAVAVGLFLIYPYWSSRATVSSGSGQNPSISADQHVLWPEADLPPAPPANVTSEPDSDSAPAKDSQLSQLLDEAPSPEDASAEDDFPDPNQTEVVTLLRDHVSRLYPDLQISDADYDRLADAVLQFRNANLSARSVDRVAGHADIIKDSLEQREAAASEFELITGIPMADLLTEEEPPVTFGADEPANETDDEIIVEYIHDYQP